MILLLEHYIIKTSHVMKSISLLLFLSFLLVVKNQVSDEETIQKLQQQLQSLDPKFITHFISFYHLDLDLQENIDKNAILNFTRVPLKQSAYLLIVAKMYLYKLLPNHQIPQLKYYQTQSNYLAAYYYLRIAAEYYENKEAYYLLGVLQQFKLVPDKGLETKLESIQNPTHQQSMLLNYLQNSHLYNAQSMLFMSSAFGFHPASLTLGYMIRNRLGTTKNCSASLAYYLSVVKETYVEQYYLRQIYSFSFNLQDQLYGRKKLMINDYDISSIIIEETSYFDSEVTQATIALADNYYMGRGGYLRNPEKAVKLYEKLAQGNDYGKLMAGICYFRGEGVPMDRVKARKYFLQISNDKGNDEQAEFLLIAMNYFEMIDKGTKPKALSIMLAKYKNSKNPKVNKRLTPNMQYLIGAAILRGQLKEVSKDGKETIIPEADGLQLIDKSVASGNSLAKVLLALLFADGVTGLKYGCEQATKFLSQEALIFPYFRERISAAQVGLNLGKFSFSMIKYMQLALVGHQDSYINLLYLLQVYGPSVLNMNKRSWSVKTFKKNIIYKQLNKNGLVDVQSLILKLYTIKKKAVLNFNNLQQFFIIDQKTIKEYHTYFRKKIIRWGSIFDKKNILKYYQYKLALQEQTNFIPILTSLAAGDSSKLYVSEARYLLGKYHHHQALQNKTELTTIQHFRILGEYNRAVKSEFLGLIIFRLQEYFLGKNASLDFFQSQIGQDLLAYIFVVSIIIFVFYYLRSRRIDHFHKAQLQKQIRKAAQQQEMERIAKGESANAEGKNEENKPQGKLMEQKLIESEIDRNQPIIIEQQPKGIRIGSSLQQQENN